MAESCWWRLIYCPNQVVTSLLLFFLFSSCAAKKLDIFPLLPYLCVSDEGMDLLSCLPVWAGLRVCLPSPPLLCCLSACLAVLPHHSSAQSTKPWFSASERVPACLGIPTGGENSSPHCYTIIACQVPFLFFFFSCLSSSLSPSFFLCPFRGSFLWWQHTLCVFTFTLVQVPSIAPLFPCSYYSS